jgi:hypothetical protein
MEILRHTLHKTIGDEGTTWTRVIGLARRLFEKPASTTLTSNHPYNTLNRQSTYSLQIGNRRWLSRTCFQAISGAGRLQSCCSGI